MDTRILLVEDEEHLIDAIKMNFELEGFVVKVAENGKKAIDLFSSQRFDLVVLDLMLPQVDGITVCETIRLKDEETPILILSAKSATQDRIVGLKAGADDYLIKPFNLEELLLRVQLLLKRTVKGNLAETTSAQFGKSTVNFKTFEFSGVDGASGTLSEKEAKLLKLLIDKENQVVSRDQILELVWGVDVYPSTRTIDNYVLNFRKYFEEQPKQPKHFFSVRGVGYKFKS